MAGVKGRSGGRRAGAGAKKRLLPPADPVGAKDAGEPEGEDKPVGLAHAEDPLDFLLAAMNNPFVSESQRIRAAIAAAQYTHQKKGEGGKKDARADQAKQTGAGKFGPASGPGLKRVA